MKLHNTRTKKIEEFRALKTDVITMYSCGPTVYDNVHIGNLASFIYADILRRAFTSNNLKVKHVMNFTDVDDKTIRRSLESYGHLGPMEALKKLTSECANQFLVDMKAVENDIDSMIFIKATDYIKEMQQLITDLYNKHIVYIADDGIYFSIDKYKKSGKKYGQLSEISAASTSEARIQNDEYDKDSIHDFAVWKKQKPSEPVWEFTLDGKNMDGRPGWHIECSAMSETLLGQPFDVHTGGVDLIFPHHENEIAQSTAGREDDMFANFFVHNEHMLIDSQKMSKSLNNFLNLNDISSKGFTPLAFRMLVLQSHYRSQANFSWESLEAAQNRLQDLYAMAALRWQPIDSKPEAVSYKNYEQIKNELLEDINDDLNTPKILVLLSELSAFYQNNLITKEYAEEFNKVLQFIDSLLGLNLKSIKDITDEQKQLIAKREEARTSKNWPEADALRDTLHGQGIGLRDTEAGVIWYPALLA